MAYIEWFDQLATGLEEVDAQHRQLLNLLNELYESLKKGSTKVVLNEILNELVNYSLYHFTTEEELMATYNYPFYDEHKKVHENFKTVIKDFIDKELTQKGVTIDLLLFLKDWLVKHILIMDKKMGKYLNKRA